MQWSSKMLKNIVFIACTLYLISSVVYISPATGLTAPYEVTGKVTKDYVSVKWEHQLEDEPIHGYYVSVQEIQQGLRLGTPDFVHVGSGTHAVDIRGLKPKSIYEIKVIGYSENEHEASDPIVVSTKKLRFLKAFDLTVSAVTSTTAAFSWQHNPKNNVHDVQFKLVCSGVQTFSRDGKQMEEWSEFEHTAFSTSKPRDGFFTDQLLPNTDYTCYLVSLAGKVQSKPTSQVEFTTAPGKPLPPPQPKLLMAVKNGKQKNSSFTAELYPTDDQNGPIGDVFPLVSHYKVFAVPVYKGKDQSRSMPYEPKVPINQLLSHSVSPHLVAKVADPIPFLIGRYEAHSLPETLDFDEQWLRKAFKPKTHYSVVVAAFTKIEDDFETLYSFSEPADPPVFIAADLRKEWVKSRTPAARRFTFTILATLLSVIGIFSLAFAAVFGTGYYKAKKRDAYFFSVADTDSESSEDEIYKKPEQQPLKLTEMERQPLPPPPPPTADESLAEWAVENMCYNPAFEEMIYRSPETMKEMNEVLERIVRKYSSSGEVPGCYTEGILPQASPLETTGQRATTAGKVVVTSATIEDTAKSSQQYTDTEAVTPTVDASATPTLAAQPSTPPNLPLTPEPSPQGQASSNYMDTEDPLAITPPPSPSPATLTSDLYHHTSQLYKSQGSKPSPSAGRASDPAAPLPSYYYTTSNPAPGTSLEEYNIAAGASPMPSVHRTPPPPVVRRMPTRSKNRKRSSTPSPKLASPQPCWDAEALHRSHQGTAEGMATAATQPQDVV